MRTTISTAFPMKNKRKKTVAMPPFFIGNEELKTESGEWKAELRVPPFLSVCFGAIAKSCDASSQIARHRFTLRRMPSPELLVNVTIKCKNAQGFISFFVNGDKVRSLYLLGELLRREKRFACWHFSFEEKYPKEGGGCDRLKHSFCTRFG